MTIRIEAALGEGIQFCANEAVRIAQLLGVTVEFTFNEVLIRTTKFDIPGNVVRRYRCAVEDERNRRAAGVNNG